MQLRNLRAIAVEHALAALAVGPTTDKPAPPQAPPPQAPPPQADAQTVPTRPLPIRVTAGDIARPDQPRALAQIDAAALSLRGRRDAIYAALDATRAQRGDADAGLVAVRFTMLSPSQIALDWMRDATQQDASSDLVFLYSDILWEIAGFAQKLSGHGTIADGIAESSAAMTLLGFVLVLVDGARCVDATGAGARLEKMLPRAARFKQLAALPAERRSLIRATALDIERRTATARREDPSICMDGIGEIGRIMGSKGGTQTERSGSQTGHFGRVVEIGAGPDYIPQYLPPAQQAEAMAKARPIAAEFVAQLLP